MALKNLQLKNFRGILEGTFQFHPKTRITGPNGVGKSSIKEAICFAFAGSDSNGVKNPTHLITQGQNSTEVIISTDKATLSRRLNDKGVTQIKLTIGDMTQPLTQTQLEGMVGSPDLFMSTFLPGYFMHLPTEKQQKVLHELLPQVDRRALLESVSGIQLTDQEALSFGLSRRIDLIAGTIATARREKEKTLASLQGEAKGIMSTVDHMDPPQEPKEASEILGKQTLLKEAWENHRRREEDFFHAEIRGLRAQYRPMPEHPILAMEVSSENCPTCGQIVGSRHRDKVQKLNMTAQETYEKRLTETQDFNRDIEAQVEQLERKLHKVQRGMEFFLEGKPNESYDSYAHTKAQDQVKQFITQDTLYKRWKTSKLSAQKNIHDLQKRCEAYSQEIGRLRFLEEKTWEIPKIEFARQLELLQMKEVVIDMTDAITIVWRGLPYYCLSDGQKMRAGIEVCKKFNSLLKKPLNVIFLDNAELMDTRDNVTPDVQWFVCEISAATQGLVVSE